MNTTDSFGYWVRRYRKALDFTQEELAQKVGCAVVTLRKIEADERHPSRLMAERLAQCLRLPASEIPCFLAVAAGEQAPDRLQLPVGSKPNRLPGNLPAPVTSLVGRTAEFAAITNCLHRKEVRLHTLTGPVGVGKTRLAIEMGQRLRHEFRDGVYLIALESVQDPALVPLATARVLGVREGPGMPLEKSVVDYLAQKEMLLIFDNFEHLQPAAIFLSTLLAAAPGLVLLVTSRACLHIYGEHEFVISPLPLPDPADRTNSASVRLFCDRAQAVRADFRLTSESTPIVAEICRRLDGLPLAIELAASRIKLFTPVELLQRLDRRFLLLTQDNVNRSSRLQGLESAIAWSFGLLPISEQILFTRLAVFVGGFTLEAAEVICSFPFTIKDFSTNQGVTQELLDVPNSMSALLDQSLLLRLDIVSEAGCESRFTMLETIREFAVGQLQTSKDFETIQRHHAAYFSSWVDQAEAQLNRPDQVTWLRRLERDIDNLQAAVTWLLRSGQVETAARMACTMGILSRRHGHYSEGRARLDQVLACTVETPLPDILQAKIIQTAASLAYRQGDYPVAQRWLAESLALYQSNADLSGVARVLFDLGWIAIDHADWHEALRLNQESLAMARDIEDHCAIYRALTNLGWTKLCTGDHSSAAVLFSEAHELTRRIGHTKGVAVSLANLGWIALLQNDIPHAAALAIESLQLCHLLGEKEVLAECLEILAAASVKAGNAEGATILSGAVQALWEGLHIARSIAQHSTATHAQAVADMRQQLSEEVFLSLMQQGRSMSVESVITYALDHLVVEYSS